MLCSFIEGINVKRTPDKVKLNKFIDLIKDHILPTV